MPQSATKAAGSSAKQWRTIKVKGRTLKVAVVKKDPPRGGKKEKK